MSQSFSNRTNDRAGNVQLPECDLHRLLASDRRRILLELLEDRSTSIDLDELAIIVAKRVAGVDSTEPEDVDQTAIALHHHHLPMLDAAGIVEYRPASNTVEKRRELIR